MQTKPTLTSQRVWSSTDMLQVEPTNATWSAGVITFTSKNHGIGNGDSVTVSCANVASPWNIGVVIATLVDKDTFTVPLVSDPGQFPNTSPYPYLNNDAKVTVSCAKYSKTFYLIDALQVETLNSSTIQLQAKLHDDAPWVNITATLNVGINSITQYNFGRMTFATGSTAPIVYTQRLR